MTRLYLPISRRSFVRLSAYGAAAAAFGSACSTQSAPPEPVENLIIGTGFGGSITAYRLAQAGHSSVLLERGKRWTVPTPGANVFSNMGLGMADNRSAWLADQQPLPGIPPRNPPFVHYTGVLERIHGDGIDIVCAAGVGGGSLVYSGMMVQPPQDLFDQVFGPTGVTWDEMNSMWYPMARSMMGTPTPLPDDIYNDPHWLATRTYLEQADHAGYATGGTGRKRSDRLYCAFDWNGARMEMSGAIPQQLMIGSYIFGLNSGAKGTLDKFYLGMAEMSGRAEVRDLHWVQRIIQRSDGWLVEVDAIDTAGNVMGHTQILARRLFVCAGTANTNGLLLRAKAEHTIDGLPDAIGEGFGNNGQHIMARGNVTRSDGMMVPNVQAGPACAMIFDYDMKIGMENGPANIPLSQMLISTGQGIPDAFGSITWDATMGKIVPHWTASNDASAHAAATQIIANLNAANGGNDSTNTLFTPPNSITFHPLGGCVMGQATDRFGRVMGQRNLYVIDGSLIPGSTPCSNPFWTISANSERCIADILAHDFT
jgi:cholesterol oxidase